MDVRQLRYFLTLAEELHFARAAERLHIVQPALSMQIKALETELDTRLFDRSQRQVRLTAAGRALLPEARRCIEQIDVAAATVRSVASGAIGRVRVGYSPSAVYSGLLKRCIDTVGERYPGIEVSIEEMHPQSQPIALAHRQVDIALGTTLSLRPGATCARLILAEFPLRLVLPAHHRLAAQSHIEPVELIDEPFIGYAGQEDSSGLRLTRRVLPFEPRSGGRASNPMMALGLVEAGFGISLLSSILSSRFNGAVVYRDLPGLSQKLDVSMLTHVDESEPAIQRFRDTVADQLCP